MLTLSNFLLIISIYRSFELIELKIKFLGSFCRFFIFFFGLLITNCLFSLDFMSIYSNLLKTSFPLQKLDVFICGITFLESVSKNWDKRCLCEDYPMLIFMLKSDIFFLLRMRAKEECLDD